MERNLLIVSTSTIHGRPYLSYLTETISEFFSGCHKIAFIPYARPSGISHDEYTAKAKEVFNSLGFGCVAFMNGENPLEAVGWADGFLQVEETHLY